MEPNKLHLMGFNVCKCIKVRIYSLIQTHYMVGSEGTEIDPENYRVWITATLRPSHFPKRGMLFSLA